MSEGGEIVKKINHTHFKLHLDTKTIFYTQENLKILCKNMVI